MKTHTQLEATWLKGLDDHTPLLEITLHSRCFTEEAQGLRNKHMGNIVTGGHS